MKFSNYALRRKQGFSNKAAMCLSGEPTMGDIIAGSVIAAFLVLFIILGVAQAIDDWFDERDLQVSAVSEARAQRAEQLMLVALNGGAVKVSGDKAIFFDRAKEEKLWPSSKHFGHYSEHIDKIAEH